MRVYRLCKARYASTAFDGDGARRYGGRWNPVGTGVVYCSGSLSLATLEALTAFGRTEAPSDHVSIEVEIPKGVTIERIDVQRLPRSWREYPAPEALAEIGREWVESGRSAVLAVPSAVTPSEWNYLLNPGHPDFRELEIAEPKAFTFDPRLT
jgi:RES domain-containing protein